MKPILFNTPMVRAILDDKKTQTRRLMKQSVLDRCTFSEDGKTITGFIDRKGEWHTVTDYAPFKPGDRLYVRETWQSYTRELWPDREDPEMEIQYGHGYIYKASSSALVQASVKWRPSIHMPKKAARLFLNVTDVRLKRLKEITPAECLQEGVSKEAGPHTEDLCVEAFIRIWNGTISEKELARYGWEANPWVWVITFERLQRESMY